MLARTLTTPLSPPELLVQVSLMTHAKVCDPCAGDGKLTVWEALPVCTAGVHVRMADAGWLDKPRQTAASRVRNM